MRASMIPNIHYGLTTYCERGIRGGDNLFFSLEPACNYYMAVSYRKKKKRHGRLRPQRNRGGVTRASDPEPMLNAFNTGNPFFDNFT